MTRYHTIMDLHDDTTLGGMICQAFADAAKEYGVRLEGIEPDINEWNMFFLTVARRVLNAPKDGSNDRR